MEASLQLAKSHFLDWLSLRKSVPPFMKSEWVSHVWSHILRRKYNLGMAVFMGVSIASLWKRWRAMSKAEKEQAKSKTALSQVQATEKNSTNSRLARLVGFALDFLSKLPRLFHILYPSIQSKESLVTAFLCLLLIVRTMLSIKIAEAMGYNAKCLVQRKLGRFVIGVIGMGIIIFPAAILGSGEFNFNCVTTGSQKRSQGSKYFANILAILFRKRLSRYVHRKYLDAETMTFYKATLDDKMDNMYV